MEITIKQATEPVSGPGLNEAQNLRCDLLKVQLSRLPSSLVRRAPRDRTIWSSDKADLRDTMGSGAGVAAAAEINSLRYCHFIALGVTLLTVLGWPNER